MSEKNGMHLYLAEIMSWLTISVLCIVTEALLTNILLSTVAAENTTCAAKRLLSGLCDAVVHLDSDFRIIRATPHHS